MYLSVTFVTSDMVLVFAFRLLNVLEVIAPFKHFNKLREFVQLKLPPGFPVKLGKKAAHLSSAVRHSVGVILTALVSSSTPF